MIISSIDLKDGKVVQLKNGRDKVLAPGFIDAHSHLDTGIEAAHRCRHMLAQGVTTVIENLRR